MPFEEFAYEIMKSVQERFDKVDVRLERVEKLQGQSYNGLVVSEKEGCVGMTLNLDVLYRELGEGKALDQILTEVQEVIRNAEYPVTESTVAYLRDYQKLKEKLMLQMVPVEGNEEMLLRVPHRQMNDLAIVYRIMLNLDQQGEASILLTHENLKGFGITPSQLEADAAEICEKNHPLTIKSMESVLFGVPEEEVKEPGLWVIGNDIGRYGAAVLSYPGALEKIAEKLESGFYLIPSSIHEVLAMPDGLQMKAKDIDAMVGSVNSSEVAPEERLSGHSYHYDREEKLFENGIAYEERKERERDLENRSSGQTNAVHEEAEPYHAAEKMKVLLVEPCSYPKTVEIGTGLSELQAAVGGNIECIYPFEDEMACIICNEEGKLSCMDPNRALFDKQGNIEDIIAGPFIVVGVGFEDFTSLTEEQLKKFEARFHQPEAFARMGGRYMVIPVKAKEERNVETEKKRSGKPARTAEVR